MKHLLPILLGFCVWGQNLFAQQPSQFGCVEQHPQTLSSATLLTDHLQAPSASYVVCDVQELPDGSRIEYREDLSGGVSKVLVRAGEESERTFVPSFNVKSVGTDRLYENFGGWNGTDNSWLPQGWSRKVSDEKFLTMENGNFTWHVGTKRNNFPAAVDGANYAIIYYANKDKQDFPQDEWLFTPYFVPETDDELSCYIAYSPFFLFDVNSGNVDFTNKQFINRKSSANLRVLISEEGSQEWTELMNLFDLWKDAEFQDLFDNHITARFEPFHLDLKAYVGKKVHIAFQYVGQYGNTMAIDAVKVSSGKRSQASYLLPEGTFYWGFTSDFTAVKGSEGESLLLTPAYTDLVWENTSSEPADQFEWTYSDPQIPNSLTDLITATDRDLVVNYGYGQYAVPALKASAEGYVPSTYQVQALGLQAGGTALSNGRDGLNQHGVGNYNLADGFTSMQGPQGGFLFGYNAYTMVDWSGMYQSMTELVSIGNKFARPSVPYALSRVWVHGVGFVGEETKLQLAVVKMDGTGQVTNDTLAVAQCVANDVVYSSGSSDPLMTFPFELQDKQGHPVVLEISDPIMVVVSGMGSAADNDFGILHTNKPAKNGECNGFFTVSNSKGVTTSPLNLLESDKGEMNNSFLIGLDATYNWLYADDDSFVFGPAGGTLKKVLTTYSYEGWQLHTDYTGSAQTDWLTGLVTDDGQGNALLQLTADALPTGVSSRQCEVQLKLPGVESKTFYITQDVNATSIQEVKQETTVSYANSCFVVRSASRSLDIYAPSGLHLQHVFLNGGEAVIPASSYASGVYLFRFSDGKAVKVVK